MEAVLSKNFFELFGIAESMEVDPVSLRERYRELIRQVHPDRHAGDPSREAEAIRASAYVNDAWDTLRNPLGRAIYLLSRKGVEIREGVKNNLPPDFLMQQMELREQLEDCVSGRNLDGLDELEQETEGEFVQMQKKFSDEFESGQLDDAAATVDRMHFLDKFIRDIDEAREKLEDEE